ncbi:OLC1v1026393C2 [Oldenlandia corymbosa var. corymbosa]|uniref:OLC1v1026393C2 n=1 Tax=Oldenlandia corymbosa var. corymbosa TaxID=529605 RepID=A0AAV1C7J8_OLDCO|nr:OLC1v1026393C2 [Oldenlandia corymbosa var. corymbosa]
MVEEFEGAAASELVIFCAIAAADNYLSYAIKLDIEECNCCLSVSNSPSAQLRPSLDALLKIKKYFCDSDMDNSNGVADHVPNHRLCGFLRTVLKIAPTPSPQTHPPIHTRCYPYANNSDIQFVCDNDVVLLPIALASKEKGQNPSTTPSSKKRWTRIGMVNGSLSVVHQLRVLLMNKCLSIIARVIGVSVHEDEIWVVVLVDVYLLVAAWSGWQFPKCGPIASALFKHLSCDWKTRHCLLAGSNPGLTDDCGIWDVPDCHAIGCKHQCSIPEAPNRKFFELDEIFRSLPSVVTTDSLDTSIITPADTSCETGIWSVPDDILIPILTTLRPVDLVRVAATCHRLRSLTAPIIPCVKLKLFPHQQAAVTWMLQREREPEVFQHPLFMPFTTEDGFDFYVCAVSGKIVTGTVPSIVDARGGMFCDEPGLGKTITALSLILKTQGTLADPPDGVQVVWCAHNFDQRCGYYEVSTQDIGSDGVSESDRVMCLNPRRGQFNQDDLTPSLNSEICTPQKLPLADEKSGVINGSYTNSGILSEKARMGTRTSSDTFRNHSQTKRNLLNEYEEASESPLCKQTRRSVMKRKHASGGSNLNSSHVCNGDLDGSSSKRKRAKITYTDHILENETWVQCDGCGKWRKLVDGSAADSSRAWFCRMNSDPLHQECSAPEEKWNYESVTCLPGFCTKGTPGGLEENVSFFISVLKEHKKLLSSKTKKILTWLAKLSPEQLSEMETIGLAHPASLIPLSDAAYEYHFIFQAFGLIKRVEKRVTRWYYPENLTNLVFDLVALRSSLCEPLDSLRFYLSRATLIVVPANLVDHWRVQIEKHVRPGQLRVYVWGDNRKPGQKPSSHHLAWDYDIVLTTFSRLSAEWSPKKRSALMEVHWLRVILDEGHTLGSSLNVTNKLQMAVFMRASSRWVLTGTPTPNTPNSQLSHLHPVLKFLHEEVYGLNQKSWEDGILKPFEAEMEEGRLRLMQLLQRCMISARKADLKTIPPCIKKITFIDFTIEHAKSYNQLVETVRRNILLADWNDPSHVESLLNPKQWKSRSATVRNIRLSCCVAGHVRVSDAGQDIQETMDALQETGLVPHSEEYEIIKYHIRHGGNCMRCKEWCRLPVITPCRHLLCLDCVSLDSQMCPLAGCSFLYEMQSPDTRTRPENPNPKWPVPKDLIELQPSYKQALLDEWHPDWKLTSSSKVTYLVHQLKHLLEFNGRLQQDDSMEFGSFSTDSWPDKVIVFSQFLEHIHVIEQQLAIGGIRFVSMYSPMSSSKKMKSLATFQNDANCMVLLMDGSAALGLDLSFVTHVYLMEPIWDKSMEEQVISRAHRMGAKRPIHVETLAMRGTIEEQMLRFLDNDDCRSLLKDEFVKYDGDGARVHRTLHDFAESNYLAHLRFVQTESKA